MNEPKRDKFKHFLDMATMVFFVAGMVLLSIALVMFAYTMK